MAIIVMSREVRNNLRVGEMKVEIGESRRLGGTRAFGGT